MATSANITYGKLYTIGKSKLCWFQMCANGVGRQSGGKDMSKTKVALNPRLRLQIFHVTVKRPSKVGQRKVRSLVRNRNKKEHQTFGPFHLRPHQWVLRGSYTKASEQNSPTDFNSASRFPGVKGQRLPLGQFHTPQIIRNRLCRTKSP